MYFVKSGRINVMRKVDFRLPSKIEEANDMDFITSDPQLQDYKNNKVESKLLEVDELTNGELFGEFACILNE